MILQKSTTSKKIVAVFIATILLIAMITTNLNFKVSAAPDYTSRKDFSWGMNTHNKDYAAYPEKYMEDHVKYCAEMGMQIMRFNYNPRKLEDYKYLDKVVETTRAYGMDLMLVLDGHGIYKTGDEFEKYYETIAKRYKGKIKYYQIFNETDVYAMHNDDGSLHNPGSGKDMAHYNPVRVEEMTQKIKGGLKAFRKNDPNAKLVLNFGWWHTAILEHYIKNGIKFDIIGWDWYSDMESSSSIVELFDYLTGKYPSYDIMICEANIWPEKSTTENQQSVYIQEFMQKVYTYRSDKVIGLIFYELLDELSFEGKTFEKEAHFGFIYADKAGNIQENKQVFYDVKKLLKGKVVKPTWPNSDGNNNGGGTQPNNTKAPTKSQSTTAPTKDSNKPNPSKDSDKTNNDANVSTNTNKTLTDNTGYESNGGQQNQSGYQSQAQTTNGAESKGISTGTIVLIIVLAVIVVGVIIVLILKFKFGMF